MKRMKRLSYLLVFALLMTTLFSGTSVFAGGDYDTPQNVKTDKTEYVTTDQGKLTFSMPSYSGVTHFIITCYYLDNMPENKSKEIINGKIVPNSTTECNFDVSEFCSKPGKYQFFVTAKGSAGFSAEGTSAEFTVKKAPEDPTPGPGGGGGGGDPTPGITDVVAPSVKTIKVDQSYTVIGMANISVTVNFGKYKKDGYDNTCYDTKVELLDGSKVIRKATSSYANYFNFNNISVPYGTYKTFKIRVSSNIDGKVYSSTKNTKKVRSKQMKKITGVRATKISAKQAVVRWNSVDGATSYRIYKGAKKVKEVKSSVSKTTVKAKGAGSAKYKVVPVRKSEGKKYAGKGATAKPKANLFTRNSSTYYGSYGYAKCPYVIKKVTLTGKTYKITGYAVNNRIFKMKKYKKLKITIYADGRIVAKKTFKNLKVNVKKERSKKIVLKIKGKAGADLRHGNASSFADEEPIW